MPRFIPLFILTFIATSSFKIDASDSDLKDQIMNVLKEHPEMLAEVQKKHLEKVLEDHSIGEKQLKENINKNKQLVHSLPGISLSNHKGDKAQKELIVFVSPYCPHCLDLIKDLDQLSADPSYKIRLSFSTDRENDPASRLVATAFWIAYQMGGKKNLLKYLGKFTESLKSRRDAFEKEDLIKLADVVGLNINEFQRSMEKTLYQKELDEINSASNTLKVAGFPLIVFEKDDTYDIVLGKPRSFKDLEKILA